ncbi:RecQ family ATP-dependent DNA helicase [Silvimonas sp. JCM 19000]
MAKRRAFSKSLGKALSSSVAKTLRETFGFAELRPGQDEVIRSIAAGQDTLAIMATGAGKSLCYQLPALALPGTTLIVSPLIALMKDQQEKLVELGLQAALFNSTLSAAEEAEAMQRLLAGELEFVFVTPERLARSEFIDALKTIRIDFIVIDEAHCISQWGHDFRPAFLHIGQAVGDLGRPPILALTATATDEIIADIKLQLDRPDMRVLNTSIYRPNLALRVEHVTQPAEKQQLLLEQLAEGGTSIVYAATIKTAEATHQFLLANGVEALLYHGRLPSKQRHENQDRFMAGEVKVIVATSAFGMGIDKADIRQIIHFEFPATVEAYYQEAGRGGRDGELAECVLLYDLADQRTQKYFLGGRYPTRRDIGKVYRTLEEMGGSQREAVSTRALRQALKPMPRGKQDVILAVLRRDRLVELADEHWRVSVEGNTGEHLDNLAARFEAVALADQDKLDQMMHYAQNAQCRWCFLLEYFGEAAPFERCGHCDNCLEPVELVA